MTFTGLTADVPVTSLDMVQDFYRLVLGRDEDLTPVAGMLEWILHPSPQVAVVPGVIALLEIEDPDGNHIVFWQDLLDP